MHQIRDPPPPKLTLTQDESPTQSLSLHWIAKVVMRTRSCLDTNVCLFKLCFFDADFGWICCRERSSVILFYDQMCTISQKQVFQHLELRCSCEQHNSSLVYDISRSASPLFPMFTMFASRIKIKSNKTNKCMLFMTYSLLLWKKMQ